MLTKELDHKASKRDLPTLVLCDFLFHCKPLAGRHHLFTNQSAATERMTAYLQDIQAEIYSQEEEGGKIRKQIDLQALLFSLSLFRQAQLVTQISGTSHWPVDSSAHI